ncbi:type II toxin-antitoxin system VapC family toxin [Rhodoplanes sp. TEM]|uniref:Ribonuclease VapC n=1 Tax=Rhodoplanes tepidamans TaxID=200616 RepID=A0ABT5JFG4_RHOTP|nr:MULTISPECIES: type II toxin-antitoxin system VapC family toxin [Rhodoplanes]MDC7788228.1 type II toxin-antitoxin system VapC family toxin [Rhodoplanes tepidamans]MDC7982967.1 type II toxin-antitoxin system VapC family toxin [Rhodoplanes sp. TEM]MDQ0355904.1 ribonuclease VapC [Rhodoplanes tepidamans]
MFLDASAVVAILGREPGWQDIANRLAAVDARFFFSPLARFEAAVGLARLKAAGRSGSPKLSPDLLRQAGAAVDAFVEDLGVEEVAITPDFGHRALVACATFGKAVGHPADLNFGDCFAYACAQALGVPLVYKGDDFARTDLA